MTLQLQAQTNGQHDRACRRAELPAPLMHDLQFEMPTLEFRHLVVGSYHAHSGRFRVNACKFSGSQAVA